MQATGGIGFDWKNLTVLGFDLMRKTGNQKFFVSTFLLSSKVDKMKALKNVSPLLSKQRGVVTHSCRYMGNKTVDPLKDLRDMCKNRGYIYPVISR